MEVLRMGLIVSPTIQDAIDILIGFGAAHVSMLHHLVVEISGFAEMEHALIDIAVPKVGILAVFPC